LSWQFLLDLQSLSFEKWTLGPDVTTQATMVAYGRPSHGRRLLSGLCNNQNISTNDSLSLIHTSGWRLRDYGLDKHNLGSRRDIRSRGYIPKSCLLCWALLD
jgi:hypothetical protein